ncbi:MAG: oxidoreductase [Nocardioides sp.]|nr:oxidoreductase [Nocardioides sp.]
MTWSLTDMPDLSGKTFLVTGVTSGLGRETALELVRHDARVILAARSRHKLHDLRDELHRERPGAPVEQVVVDLTDLASVRKAGVATSKLGPIDVLINNAGVMATPAQRSTLGLDLQMVTNHFGPFLLTGLLLPQLAASGDGRVVTVSSSMHHFARSAPLGDPFKAPQRYRRWQVYAQSKLANLMFTYEFDRRLRAAGVPIKALAAHPGYSATHLLSYGQTMKASGGITGILDAAMKAGAQRPEMGAMPSLMAAVDDLPGGTFTGPSGFRELRGLPTVVKSSRLSRDESEQRELWEISQKTVGIRYP